MKISKKIFKIFIICFLVVASINFGYNNVLAEEKAEEKDFYTVAYEWLEQVKEDSTMKDAMNGILSKIGEYVEIVGTAVIIIATIVLGLRYIFASAEGKSAAKESTMNLLVACILFFGWTNISNMLYNGTSFVFYQSSDFNTTVNTIYSIFIFFAEAVALIGILYVGIKYILAGAEGKADLKSKSFPFIIGIILTFSAVEVLTIISNIVNYK